MIFLVKRIDEQVEKFELIDAPSEKEAARKYFSRHPEWRGRIIVLEPEDDIQYLRLGGEYFGPEDLD